VLGEKGDMKVKHTKITLLKIEISKNEFKQHIGLVVLLHLELFQGRRDSMKGKQWNG